MKTFQQYDQDNPHIWELYKAIAIDLIQRGMRKLGSKRIVEEIRWHHSVRTNEPYKVSNNFTAMYARKFVNEFPQYGHMFDFKPLRR
jgi:hypothetical protein